MPVFLSCARNRILGKTVELMLSGAIRNTWPAETKKQKTAVLAILQATSRFIIIIFFLKNEKKKQVARGSSTSRFLVVVREGYAEFVATGSRSWKWRRAPGAYNT